MVGWVQFKQLQAVTGFVSSTANEQVAQPGSAITGVLIAFTVLPTVLTLLSLLLLRRYRLDTSAGAAPHPGTA